MSDLFFLISIPLQIIHDRGSYSFLVCGMIFGCLAFTFYALLVFFHRMYPKPSPGKKPQPRALLWDGSKSSMSPTPEHSRKMQGNVYFTAASSLLFPALSCPQSLGSHSPGFAFFSAAGMVCEPQTAPASLGCPLAEIQGISGAAIQGQLSGSWKRLH